MAIMLSSETISLTPRGPRRDEARLLVVRSYHSRLTGHFADAGHAHPPAFTTHRTGQMPYTWAFGTPTEVRPTRPSGEAPGSSEIDPLRNLGRRKIDRSARVSLIRSR